MYQPILPNLLKSLALRRPLAAGIEITNRCNLHCPMCYWWKERPRKELSSKTMIALFKKLRRQGIAHVTLVGGEPTLRPDLIRAAAKIFPYTWVVTNGSFSKTNAPSLPNTLYIVSVDGTQRIHDQIRSPGLYRTIWKNFSHRSDCFLTTTITKTNKNELEKIVDEWSKTKILGITFDFATPTRKEDRFWLNWQEREETIDQLLILKRKYRDFILLSKKMLQLLRRKSVLQWSKNCPIRWFSISYSADGSVKRPCILGKNADCSRCGCHIAPLIKALFLLDWETHSMIRRLLVATRTSRPNTT